MGKPNRQPEESSSSVLLRALNRERLARKTAEQILEKRSLTLHSAHERLLNQNLALEKNQREIQFLFQSLSLASQQTSFQAALESFLGLCVRLSEWPIGRCWELTPVHNTIQTRKVVIRPEAHSEVDVHVLSQGEIPGWILSCIETRKSIWKKDLSKNANLRGCEPLIDSGITSVFCVPVLMGEECLAVVELMGFERSLKDDELLRTIETGAQQLGELLFRQKTLKEIAEKKEKLSETQLQLIQSEKMASLGTITAGIAHEINNPLSFVMTNIDLLCEDISLLTNVVPGTQAGKHDGELISELTSLLEETKEGLRRIRDTVRGLKTFSRAEGNEPEHSNINSALEDAIKILSNELSFRCDLHQDFGTLPDTIFFRNQLAQVFTNILLNGLHAITEKFNSGIERGAIWVQTRFVDNCIVIRIRDNGIGISEENLPKIFTPFFTTKAVGTGTGLGLSISYGIIKSHQGEIRVSSTLGQGTEFEISLPYKPQEKG